MAGTATDWNVLAVSKRPGQIWAGLAIPGGGARITLDADGTPDATANPNAVHLGMTEAGAKIMAKGKPENTYVDEFVEPILSNMAELEMAISANLHQLLDVDILKLITPGFGKEITGVSGIKGVTFGLQDISYTSIAVIFPRTDDATKFCVFHLYKAFNNTGLEADIGRKKLAGVPVTFMGLGITSRAVGDTAGAFWWQSS